MSTVKPVTAFSPQPEVSLCSPVCILPAPLSRPDTTHPRLRMRWCLPPIFTGQNGKTLVNNYHCDSGLVQLQQGCVVDWNTWLVPSPGQEDACCQPTSASSNRETDKFLVLKTWRFLSAKGWWLHAVQCDHPTWTCLLGGGLRYGGTATVNVARKQYIAECLPLSGAKLIAVCWCIDRRS